MAKRKHVGLTSRLPRHPLIEEFYENRIEPFSNPDTGVEYWLRASDLTKYADELIAKGIIPKRKKRELIEGLKRAAAYYWLGRGFKDGLATASVIKEWKLFERKNDLGEEFSNVLKRRPNSRPKDLEDFGFIWIMAIVWEWMGNKTGTAFSTSAYLETESRFQSFANGWCKRIDPNRKRMPGREKYRSALKKLKSTT